MATATLITPEALLGHPLLLPKAGTTRSRLNVWMENVEDSTQISMELDSTEMMKRFVMAGLQRWICQRSISRRLRNASRSPSTRIPKWRRSKQR
ncbi:MAG: LysR substrate-binding domain-containing protein [bacterium]